MPKKSAMQRKSNDGNTTAPSLLTRRNLLIAGGITGVSVLASAALYALLSESEEQQNVRSFVERFPGDALPGKPRTRMVRRDGAARCLVNFETLHSNPRVQFDKASRGIIIEAQREKLQLMEWCMQDTRVRMNLVFREGITQESEAGIRESEAEARQSLRRQAAALPPRERERFWSERREEILFQLGAEGLLSLDGRLAWKPAETAQTLRGGDPRRSTMQQREAVFLEQLRKEGPAIAFTTWGALHWSEENIPEDFSFISIRGRYLHDFIASGGNLKGAILEEERGL